MVCVCGGVWCGEEGAWRGGGGNGDYIAIATLSPPERIPALRRAAYKSRFTVSVGSDGQSHRTVSTNHNLF